MSLEKLWEKFIASGRISDYLEFAEAQKKGKEK